MKTQDRHPGVADDLRSRTAGLDHGRCLAGFISSGCSAVARCPGRGQTTALAAPRPDATWSTPWGHGNHAQLGAGACPEV